MSSSKLLKIALALPTHERIELFEVLRESLLNDPELHVLSEGERKLLDERLRDQELDPQGGSPWEIVDALLMSLLKRRRPKRSARFRMNAKTPKTPRNDVKKN